MNTSNVSNNPSILKTAACDAPAISVVVPVYNVEAYLKECLDSILNQSVQEIEVICVNDGSPDGSLDIVMQYARKDDRITVLDQPNSGLSAARNAGMDQARGEYLYFIDSDDYLVPGTFETLLTTARTHNTDVLYFGAESFFEDSTLRENHASYTNFYKRIPTFTEPVSGDVFLLDQLQKWRFRSSVPLQFIRRAFLVESGLRFRSGIIHEDELFSCLLAAKSRSSLCITDEFYMRRVRENSIMTAVHTARKFVGFFIVSTTLMSCAVTDPSLSPTAREAISFHAKKILRDGKDTYHQLSQCEKDKIPGLLPVEFRLLYEEMSTSFGGTQAELLAIRRSSSYRIGSFITFVPRMALRAVRGVRKYGLKFAVATVFQMAGSKLSRIFRRKRSGS